MIVFKDHKDIPTGMRQFILEETQEGRIKNVSLVVCGELAELYLEEQRVNEKLKDFSVIYINRKGNTSTFKFKDSHSAFMKMDNIIGYGPSKRKDIGLVLKQADRVLKTYYKGHYLQPPIKDKLWVKSVSA